MTDIFGHIYNKICTDPSNMSMADKGYQPLYTAGPKAKIVIIGQAPGRKAQESMKPREDASGDKLRQWLGITDTQFYNPDIVSLLPMDFYYPGKGKHGDLPPRKDFAPMRHPQLLAHMPAVDLIILIGQYAQKYYLGKQCKDNLTKTVQAYQDYLPQFFPLVHPSPLNFRRQAKNPWFVQKVIPALQKQVQHILH